MTSAPLPVPPGAAAGFVARDLSALDRLLRRAFQLSRTLPDELLHTFETGLAVPELLRASHIKPWADCGTDAERLDVYNGLLLAPNIDAAFDCGLVAFTDEGAIIVARALADDSREVLGIRGGLRARGLVARHAAYLAWHRRRVFRG